MKVFVSDLFNRGKENKYVELEAAAKCSLEVTDVPEEVKPAIKAKDYDKAYALMLAESAK